MMHRTPLLIAVLVVVFVSMICLQKKITALKASATPTERIAYLPQPEKIKPFLLGFSQTYSHYLWIRTVLYFANHYFSDNNYPWLITMIDIVTKLDPYFYPAYEFGGVMISQLTAHPDAAIIILNRGIFHLGVKTYKLPFYLGWLYYAQYDDADMASHYLSLASHAPDVPPYLPALTATLFSRVGKQEQARAFLTAAYNAAENPRVKKSIEEKLMAIGKK
ncbi:MAG: hypothetical protein JW795_10145 [Chitinivibrionales bacterium]|nr:hypothetical protein [Chitinivibrionales bacterium]